MDPTSGSPNIIGGSEANTVDSAVVGATIAGGGESGFPNVITRNFGTIGGGEGNTVSGVVSAVGGGFFNIAEGGASTIAGNYTGTLNLQAIVQ